ncbi:hypothetical protein RFI_07004, partial [Reticulomyxa filosa]
INELKIKSKEEKTLLQMKAQQYNNLCEETTVAMEQLKFSIAQTTMAKKSKRQNNFLTCHQLKKLEKEHKRVDECQKEMKQIKKIYEQEVDALVQEKQATERRQNELLKEMENLNILLKAEKQQRLKSDVDIDELKLNIKQLKQNAEEQNKNYNEKELIIPEETQVMCNEYCTSVYLYVIRQRNNTQKNVLVVAEIATTNDRKDSIIGESLPKSTHLELEKEKQRVEQSLEKLETCKKENLQMAKEINKLESQLRECQTQNRKLAEVSQQLQNKMQSMCSEFEQHKAQHYKKGILKDAELKIKTQEVKNCERQLEKLICAVQQLKMQREDLKHELATIQDQLLHKTIRCEELSKQLEVSHKRENTSRNEYLKLKTDYKVSTDPNTFFLCDVCFVHSFDCWQKLKDQAHRPFATARLLLDSDVESLNFCIGEEIIEEIDADSVCQLQTHKLASFKGKSLSCIETEENEFLEKIASINEELRFNEETNLSLQDSSSEDVINSLTEILNWCIYLYLHIKNDSNSYYIYENIK